MGWLSSRHPRLVKIQAMVQREHEEGCALTEMRKREISGMAFTYLLATLDIPQFPPIPLYWIDSFRTMK